MGTLAESYGLRQGLKYRKPVKQELETVLRLDPAFQQGSADRALGRWYFRVPGLFGGSRKQAEDHLRASLTYNPNSTASHFFLAELFVVTLGRQVTMQERALLFPQLNLNGRLWFTQAYLAQTQGGWANAAA